VNRSETKGLDGAVRRTRLRRRRAERATAVNGLPWSMRVEILKSAAAAFRRHGYHGATVEHIAAALKMKKGNLYYYFKNKEEILFACHQYSLDKLLAILEQIEQRDGSADAKLRDLIDAFVHTILDELQGTALFLDLEALSPMHRRAVIARRDRFDRGLRQVLQQGVGDGTFGAIDVKLLSFAILGAVNWIPRWYQPDGPATSQEIADRFADFLLGGLRSL
jgi:TetR/AcrR family transcriptional regulator, cholesterol catabolism regulator